MLCKKRKKRRRRRRDENEKKDNYCFNFKLKKISLPSDIFFLSKLLLIFHFIVRIWLMYFYPIWITRCGNIMTVTIELPRFNLQQRLIAADCRMYLSINESKSKFTSVCCFIVTTANFYYIPIFSICFLLLLVKKMYC